MFHVAATAAFAAGSVVTAALRSRVGGTDGDSRERGCGQDDFRDSFHCNSPVLI
jgi:hypothetical protein